jgi:hypothetical protein
MLDSPICQHCQNTSRRQFLRQILGAGSLATGMFLGQNCAFAAEKKLPKALVLSCIDYRILEAERYFLSLQNLSNQYDFTALAGSSLALTGLPHQADATAFWDQLEISYRVHHIKKVIILDHQDCAVYADKIDPALTSDPKREIETHTEYLSRAYWQIRDRYPDLNIELYFVGLDAEVKSIAALPKPADPAVTGKMARGSWPQRGGNPPHDT